MSDKATQCCTCRKPAEGKLDKRGALRLPRGWKRRDDELFCKDCWAKLYVIRAVTMPVAGPVDLEWADLRKELAAGWADTTRLANWAITELAKADVQRLPGVEKMPKMEPLYLYPAARRQVPMLPPQTVVAVLHAVEGRYRKARYDLIWRGAVSLPRFRYPVPWPIHNQSWTARWLSDEEHVPIISVRLSGARVALRLRGGVEYRRQLAAFSEIVSGAAVPTELTLYRQRVTGSDHRPGVVAGAPGPAGGRAPGGSERVYYRVMAKLVAWLPRRMAKKVDEKHLRLSTAKDCFWMAELDGRTEPWLLFADHVQRWIRGYQNRLARMAHDTKYEKRWPKRAGKHMADARTRWVEKHQRRIKTWCHQASAALVGYAERQKVTVVRYDDTERSYLPDFPWAHLRELLSQKLGAVGIEFSAVGAVEEGADPGQEPGAPEPEDPRS